MQKNAKIALAVLLLFSFGLAANVTFTVNMSYEISQGNLVPATDSLDIAGSFNSWGEVSHYLSDANADSIWDITIDIPEGDIEFKFRINGDWGTAEFPGGSNRTYTVVEGDQGYDCWYNDFSPTPVVKFTVDMANQIALGNFDPATDSLDIAGNFNSWGEATSFLSANTYDSTLWEITVDTFSIGNNLEFKFRINGSWDTAEFPGGSNRQYTVGEGVQEYSVYWDDFDYNLAITFKVNMSHQISLGNMNPATDSLDIAGSFNSWGEVSHYLSDANTDSIYEITIDDTALIHVGDNLEFKFRINGSWDTAEFPGGSNRQYTVGTGAQEYSVWWNDFDPNFIGSDVHFSVNLKAQIAAGGFNPDSNNIVQVQGSFDGWAGTDLEDADSDSIYDAVISVPIGVMQYKFAYVDTARNTIVENLTQNRRYTVEESSETIELGTVWFNDLEYLTYGSANITFRVDMTVLQELGFYDRLQGDSLELRGSFNGWGSSENRNLIDMLRQPGAEIYYLTIPYEGWRGDNEPYKFFLNLHQIAGGDSAAHAGDDFYEYELPAAWGGGNRWFTWHGMNSDTVLQIQTFQDYVTEGVIPENDSVLVHLQIDMTDALSYEEDAFDPAADRLFFVWYDAWGALLQNTAALNVPDDSAKYEYHDTGTDNIWKCSFYITGPAPHAIMYKALYVKSDGTEVEEIGDPFDYGRYRTQWLKPDASGYLPREQNLGVVTFSIEGLALEVEPEPFANGIIYSSVDEGKAPLPTTFALKQNYPNPFNPVTEIQFTIPEKGEVAFTIYNILGQTVMSNNKEFTAPGTYQIRWNGTNYAGKALPSGIYFYELKAGDYRAVKKMTLLK